MVLSKTRYDTEQNAFVRDLVQREAESSVALDGETQRCEPCYVYTLLAADMEDGRDSIIGTFSDSLLVHRWVDRHRDEYVQYTMVTTEMNNDAATPIESYL